MGLYGLGKPGSFLPSCCIPWFRGTILQGISHGLESRGSPHLLVRYTYRKTNLAIPKLGPVQIVGKLLLPSNPNPNHQFFSR